MAAQAPGLNRFTRYLLQSPGFMGFESPPQPFEKPKIDMSALSIYLRECVEATFAPSMKKDLQDRISKRVPRECTAYSFHGRDPSEKVKRQTGFAIEDGVRSDQLHRVFQFDYKSYLQLPPNPHLVNAYQDQDGQYGMAQLQGFHHGENYSEDVYWSQVFQSSCFGIMKITALCDGHNDLGSVGCCLFRHLAHQLVRYLQDAKRQSLDQTDAITSSLTKALVELSVEIGQKKNHQKLNITVRNPRISEHAGATVLIMLQLENGWTYFANAGDSAALWIRDEKQVEPGDLKHVKVTESADLFNKRFVQAIKNLCPEGVPPLYEDSPPIYGDPLSSDEEASFVQVRNGLRSTLSGLAPARDCGHPNHPCRPKISALPPGSEGIIVLFSDGISGNIRNRQIAQFVRDMQAADPGCTYKDIALALATLAYDCEADCNPDDITVVIAQLNPSFENIRELIKSVTGEENKEGN